MTRRLHHSISVKVLLPLAVCGVLAALGFAAWARAADGAQDRARALHTGRVFAGALELSGDLSGAAGLERAATVLGAERGIGLLVVMAGTDRVVVASNDLTIVQSPSTTLNALYSPEVVARSAAAGTEPFVAWAGDHFDVGLPLDLGALALRDPRYSDASLLVDVEPGYAGLGSTGGDGALRALWLLLGLMAALVVVSSGLLSFGVLRPLKRLNRAISARREGASQDLPLGDPDEIGLLARSLDDAFARIDDHERALSDSEQRFRAIVEEGNDLVVVVDSVGRISYASPSAGRVLGYAVDEVVGRDAFSFVCPDDLDKAGGRFLELLERPGAANIQQFEVHLVASDGHLIPVEVRGNNRFDAPGVDGLILNMRDVTERHEAFEALRVSETRNRAILESAADGILMLSADGRIESCNGAAERMFGRTSAGMVGASIALLVPTRSEGLHDASLTSESADAGQARFVDLEGRRADGGVFPVEAAVSATASTGGLSFTVVLRDVTEQREYERQLAHQALHDALTGLPNRRALLDRAETAIARARRSGHLVSVLFLDLDRFKVVNDSLGHEQGDNLLRLAAERMLHSIRESDTLARIGGDEFVILCEDVESVLSITELAARLCTRLDEPFRLGESEAFVGGSIGIAIWDGGEATPDDLLRRADTAMYRAKEGGRGRYALFDEEMQAWAVARLDFETALRHAVARDEMVAHYQPVVNLTTGRVVGLEALVRWERPGHGLVPPGDFIAVAEETGLIVPIGAWVIDEACRQAGMWQRDFGQADLSMHVNLSSRQLMEPEVIDTVRTALETHGLDPTSLTLEITESIFLDDAPHALALLRELKDLGVRLALDDFGTGYSSLTYLHSYPIDEIKIDRSFVQLLSRDTNGTIVAAIMQLSRALGLDVVAEGIEEPEQAATLLRLGCERGQGFLYSRPVSAEMMSALLTSGADLGGCR